MTHPNRYHGGLVVFGYDGQLLDRFSRIAAATMEDYGHPVESNIRRSARVACVTASFYTIRLTLMQGMQPSQHGHRAIRLDPFGAISMGHGKGTEMQWRVQIEMIPSDPTRDDRDISELLLVVMLYRMIDISDTRMVEWLDPLTLLKRDEFVQAFGSISPALVEAGAPVGDIDDPRFAPVDEMSRFYQHRHGDPVQARKLPTRRRATRSGTFHNLEPAEDSAAGAEERPSDVQRLATWAMTGMMLFLSFPVAAVMAAINLLKGEDFRLNTHVLTLTGLLVMLQSTGLLGAITDQLPL